MLNNRVDITDFPEEILFQDFNEQFMLEERAKHIKITNAVTYAAAKLAKDEIIDRKMQIQQLD